MTTLLDEVTRAAEDVYGTLGLGLSETTYRNAMAISLRARGIPVESERTILVVYKGQHVGTLRADLVLHGRYVVELKVCARITDTHEHQCRAYISRLEGANVGGVLVNFGAGGVDTRSVE